MLAKRFRWKNFSSALLKWVGKMGDQSDHPAKHYKAEVDRCSEEPESPANQEIDNVETTAESNTSAFRLKLFNIPKYINQKELKKEIVSQLKDRFTLAENEPKVKKAPNWNFAFATFSNSDAGAYFLSQLEQKTFVLRKAVIRGEVSREITERQPREPTSVAANILDQVVPLHAMPYAEQLHHKLDELKSHLPAEISPLLTSVVESPCINGYRNKNEFSVGWNAKGEPEVGFTMGLYKDGIVAVESAQQCPHISAGHKQIAEFFCSFIRRSSLAPLNRTTGTGYWRILLVRSNQNGEHMVGIQMHPQQMSAEEIASIKNELIALFTDPESSLPTIASLQLQLSASKTHGISSKDEFQLLHGSSTIYEHLYEDSLKFQVSLNSFFQVNTPATEKLYETVRTLATAPTVEPTSGCTLLDLCCGTGTIGICMAKHVDQVLGVEMVESAVQDAKINAELNGAGNVEFVCSKLEDCIEDVVRKINPLHSIVVVLDPPRSGAHPSVIGCLKRSSIASRITRIVYVSCNAALAKGNFESLMRATTSKNKSYYVPESATMVDLFPHTKHVELVLSFKPHSEPSAA